MAELSDVQIGPGPTQQNTTPVCGRRDDNEGVLGPDYIKTVPGVNERVANFFQTHSMLQCLGEIDYTHGEVKNPLSNSTDLINRKCYVTTSTVSWTLLLNGRAVYVTCAYLPIHN